MNNGKGHFVHVVMIEMDKYIVDWRMSTVSWGSSSISLSTRTDGKF